MSPSSLEGIVHREYPERGRAIFMNAASWGLVPGSAVAASVDVTRLRNVPDGVSDEIFGGWAHRCREIPAGLIGVSPEEISLSVNTSYGVNLAAGLVAAGSPGTVVVSDGEFPANVLPWKTLEDQGFTVQVVPRTPEGWPDEEALVAALDGVDVRALAVSAVQYVSGYKADLARLGAACRERDILFCVDAIQQLGAAPLDARACSIDVLSTGGQKWLCSPWGSGFTYVRRALQERFEPPMVGWLSVKGSTRFEDGLAYGMEWLDDGRKFELATLAFQDYLGLARTIEVFQEIGLDRIRAHIAEVQAPLVEWVTAREDVRPLTPVDPERRAGIFSFFMANQAEALTRLEDAGVGFAVREGAVRIAPHVYNTADEMREVVRLLEG